MGGHNGPQLGVKIDILVSIRFHVTCIQSSCHVYENRFSYVEIL